MANETCVEPCLYGVVPKHDPQISPTGCFAFNNSLNDSFNGLTKLNSPSRPDLIFPDPYVNEIFMNVGYCTKYCIDFMFSYAGMENGTNCRCGDNNALQSYIQVDDSNCNISCTSVTLKGNATYPCGGKGFYTVYKTDRPDYRPPLGITIEEKLNIMDNINKEPNYKGCFEDNKICGQRILGNKCETLDTITVNLCIDYCREGNFKYAGLETSNQCFCGNSYGDMERLLPSEYCSASCGGNNSQICGGIWALSIYEVPTPSTSPPNKRLIIGLSVGLGIPIFLIIVIGVAFLIYRNRNSNNPKNDLKNDLKNLNDDPNNDDPIRVETKDKKK
ncbi:WSC domain-containing protein [Glomus cerebriforme]|uniref:WSC domain-containing protein n=1 Tax=Glomus cerebriforme TaxID=658196 RepID=A0A397TK50_9GLOM|nr:WSC domain-containing protein [Glomus cerebriforme]